MLLQRKVLEKLADQINKNFTEDFGFPKDFVCAKVADDGCFSLRIGDRDIQVTENGSLVGTGTDINLMQRYTVIDRHCHGEKCTGLGEAPKSFYPKNPEKADKAHA